MSTKLYAAAGSRQTTLQTEPIPGRAMVANNAGGFGFPMDPWTKLDQFLILGTQGGTYYVQEKKLTKDALSGVVDLIAEDGPRVVARVAEISKAGRAVRNTPALWVLAACQVLGDEATKRAANQVHGDVVRIGTHLFQWAHCMKELGTGWGRGIKRAINRWYLDRPADSLIYQLTKYRQREGWTHRDLLRLGHVGSAGLTPTWDPLSIACPKCDLPAGFACQTNGGNPCKPHAARTQAKTETIQRLQRALGWAAGKIDVPGDLESEDRLAAFVAFQEQADRLTADYAAAAIRRHRFTHEMVPTALLKSLHVWAALIDDMPIGAMLRNLGRLSSVGVLKPLSEAETTVCQRLRDPERIRRSRMHPAAVLQAIKIYGQGKSLRGSLTWEPTSGVKDALEDAFDLAFENVKPCGQRLLLGIDASGSMSSLWPGPCAGLDALMPVEGAAAMALAVARKEPRHHILGFDNDIRYLGVTARTALGDVVRKLGTGGGTNGALPMEYALRWKIEVDAFVIMTDSETWSGSQHPCQALDRYRQGMGINAKLVVVGMCANGHTFGDPEDGGTLDVVGFDANAPRVIIDFCRPPVEGKGAS